MLNKTLNKTRVTGIAASLLVTAALAIVPATGVGAANVTADVTANVKQAAGPQACAAVTSELTSGLTSVTGALGAIPPDLSKVTGIVGTLTKTVQSLISLGCLPDPLSVVPAAPLKSELLPIPGLPGAPAVPPCAAPAADLLSKLLALVSNLLKTLGGGLPDVTGLLGQVTGVQSTVTGLTSSVGGAQACLPVNAPVKQ